MLRIRSGLVLFSVFVLNLGQAAKHFVWGGGPVKEHSQVVLERNLNLFHEIADGKGIPATDRKTYFGAGLENTADVVYQSREATEDEKLMATFSKEAAQVNMSFRHNEVKNLTGDATKINILDEVSQLLRSLGSTEKSRFYFTGHGHNEEPHFENNFFISYLGEKVSVEDFATVLDESQSEGSSQIVMTQCFSGGFAQIVYDEGKFKGTLSKKNRCGFFSEIPSRVAAGCSADILAREEYSPYFFAALSGRHENGTMVNADSNGDSVVSAREAHFYVVATENSFDIPVTTSSEFLANEFSTHAAASLSDAELLGSLSAEEKAAFGKLSELTGLSARGSGQSAQDFVKLEITRMKQSMALQQRDTNSKFSTYRNSVLPLVGQINAMETTPTFEEMKSIMLAFPGYDRIKTKFVAFTEAATKSHALTVTLAKLERLEYLFKSKAYEKVLAVEGSLEEKAKYKQLLDCENEAYF